MPDDSSDETDPVKKLRKIEDSLSRMRRSSHSAAIEYGEALELVHARRVYLESLPQPIPLSVGTSIDPLWKAVQAREAAYGSLNGLHLLNLADVTTSTATAVAVTSATLKWEKTFDGSKTLWKETWGPVDPPVRWWTREGIASITKRLNSISPTLSQLAQASWDSYHGGAPLGERSALESARQLIDTLQRELAPDPEVRESPHFVEKESGNPQRVYRRERLAYMLEKRAPERWQALVGIADELLNAYDELQRLHKPEPVSRVAAKAMLEALFGNLEVWLEALGY